MGADKPFFLLNGQTLRLPRLVEAEPRGRHIPDILASRRRILWQGSDREVPACTLSARLVETLLRARGAGHLVRGLESAAKKLANEDRGLALADQYSSKPRGVRISRLLVLADDGAERFYRQVESLLDRHGPRLLALRLDADEEALGGSVFGQGSRARLLMLDHKEAVSAFLLALADHSE